MNSHNIETSLKLIRLQIQNSFEIYKRNNICTRAESPVLVAVSKFVSPDIIKIAYDNDQKHFGENYIMEMYEKGMLLKEYRDLKWHFIGKIQKNKIKKLLDTPNLYLVETVDSVDVAESLQKELEKHDAVLNILIQVNTSEEKNKNGCNVTDLTDVAKYIIEKCTRLKLEGLMSIGSTEPTVYNGINPDFDKLVSYSKKLEGLGMLKDNHIISMGMSSDFEAAISQGSTSVRIGTKIFGPRNQKNEGMILND